MRLLVLGGTVFLSRAVAVEAIARGHEVTCACRGDSGSVPAGARLLPFDRSVPGPADALVDGAHDWDAVVDVARSPTWVARAVAAVPDAHWVLVSTCNVYASTSGPGTAPEDLPLLEPVWTDEDPTASSEAYGALKVACESHVRSGAASSTVVRPGLVVGPEDPSGRFAYWPRRLADGGEVLAPGDPTDPVQLIDVRDLASWLVTCAEQRTDGVFHGIGRPVPRAVFLDRLVAAVAPPGTTLTWVGQDFLTAHEVEPWSGPRSVPLWLPLPEYAGFLSLDPSSAYDEGLVTRPIGDTGRDTLTWLRATPGAPVGGLTREEEAEVLRAWDSVEGGRQPI